MSWKDELILWALCELYKIWKMSCLGKSLCINGEKYLRNCGMSDFIIDEQGVIQYKKVGRWILNLWETKCEAWVIGVCIFMKTVQLSRKFSFNFLSSIGLTTATPGDRRQIIFQKFMRYARKSMFSVILNEYFKLTIFS